MASKSFTVNGNKNPIKFAHLHCEGISIQFGIEKGGQVHNYMF